MDFDIAIIGASTAGLHAAELLALAGKHVALFEQQSEIHPARRTMIVTPTWPQVLGYEPETVILHKISVMSVKTRGAAIDIGLRSPDLIIERAAFIQYLLSRATNAGVEVHFGYRLQKAAPHLSGVELHFDGKADDNVMVTVGAVIGADGAFSDVAKLAGIPRPATVPILQAEIKLPADWDVAVTKVWFDTEETKYFYWLIPESEERAVVGLVADHKEGARFLLSRFLEKQGWQPLAYQGAQVAMHHPSLRPWGRVGGAPVYLVGDAAGQVKVTTVGGSVSGLWGAQAAVQALVQDIPYRKTIRSLKRELDAHWWVRVALNRLGNKGYDALVRSLSPRAARFLSQRTRDEMAGGLWQMVFSTPSLWRLIPYLLRGTKHSPRIVQKQRRELAEAEVL